MVFNRAERLDWPVAEPDAVTANMIYETFGRSGWRGGTIGRERWGKIVLCALAEAPTVSGSCSNINHGDIPAWSRRTKVLFAERYGSIIATILISIAVRIVIEMIIAWWKNRDTPALKGEHGSQVSREEMTEAARKSLPEPL